jgi:hypothetical protein
MTEVDPEQIVRRRRTVCLLGGQVFVDRLADGQHGHLRRGGLLLRPAGDDEVAGVDANWHLDLTGQQPVDGNLN